MRCFFCKLVRKLKMKPELESLQLLKNDEKQRFELQNNGHIAFIDFEEKEHLIALVHTEAPEELQGTGTAVALVEKTLQHIEKSGKKVMPYCPFVLAYIKKHPAWKHLVSEKFPGYEQL